MAVARDFKGKRDRIVAVINNETTMAGQVYEAMSNAGYLDSNMIVILNDSQHSLHPKLEEASKTPINALSSTLSKLQSSKFFRRFRELAKVFPYYIYKRTKLPCLFLKPIINIIYIPFLVQRTNT
jgi:1-deoxy-D-xylulose-5-phosphate synthase